MVRIIHFGEVIWKHYGRGAELNNFSLAKLESATLALPAKKSTPFIIRRTGGEFYEIMMMCFVLVF